jgi:hypothetical protein
MPTRGAACIARRDSNGRRATIPETHRVDPQHSASAVAALGAGIALSSATLIVTWAQVAGRPNNRSRATPPSG